MTLAEILEDIQNRLRGVHNLNEGNILQTINSVYQRVSGDVLAPDTLTTESLTWTSGSNELDLSSTVTDFRDQPYAITSSDYTFPWDRIGLKEIIDRRPTQDQLSDSGRLVYAVTTNKLHVVSAFTSDQTITMVHYKKPPDLADMTDVPLLPTDAHKILVSGTQVELLRFARGFDPSLSMRGRTSPDEQAAFAEFSEDRIKLKKLCNPANGMNFNVAPNVFEQGYLDTQNLSVMRPQYLRWIGRR